MCLINISPFPASSIPIKSKPDEVDSLRPLTNDMEHMDAQIDSFHPNEAGLEHSRSVLRTMVDHGQVRGA